MFGFLNIYKPAGITSHDVVARLRRALKIKQIGHAGTLDPFAQGVLPVAVGKATRLIEFLTDDKEYIATVNFGQATTTYDIEGEVTFESDRQVSEAEIIEALKDFQGDILQTPPMYSAIKVNGKKLYDYARKGQEVEVKPREVNIETKLLEFDGHSAQIHVKCSKGTYIRSIAHDLGQKLGVGAHLTKLVRIRAGKFSVENSTPLDEPGLINPLEVLDLPQYICPEEELDKIRHGQYLVNKSYKDGEIIILTYNKNIAAVGCAQGSKILMKKVILTLALMLIPLAALAECDYTCVKPYDLVNPTARVLLNVTGSNLIAKQYAKSLVKKMVNESLDYDKMKVDIRSYSAVDLKAGRFQSLEIEGENINADGVYVSYMKLKTLCDFNYVVPDEKNNTTTFKEDFPLSFNIIVSDEDLNKTMNSQGYDKVIADMNTMFEKNGGLIRIETARARIRNGRFIYAFRFDIPFINKIQEIAFSSDLRISNGRIKFEDTKVIGTGFSLDLNKISYILNFLNPLDYSLEIIDNKNTNLVVSNLKVEENKILMDGVIVTPKDVVTGGKTNGKK